MLKINRSAFQGYPFHLVSPSPWPIFTFYFNFCNYSIIKISDKSREFSTSRILCNADSDNGDKLDDNNAIMKKYAQNIQNFNAYFIEKETSIRRDCAQSISTALDDGVDVNELTE